MAAHRTSSDAIATLAGSVRSLASEAHRTLNDPRVTPTQIDALARRVARLEREVPPDPFTQLSSWLSSLRKTVDARLN